MAATGATRGLYSASIGYGPGEQDGGGQLLLDMDGGNKTVVVTIFGLTDGLFDGVGIFECEKGLFPGVYLNLRLGGYYCIMCCWSCRVLMRVVTSLG